MLFIWMSTHLEIKKIDYAFSVLYSNIKKEFYKIAQEKSM